MATVFQTVLRVIVLAVTVLAAPAVLAAPGALPGLPIAAPEHPERPVVIELFSSQACGRCPEANQVLESLARRSDVIALTYPVGYWNYLGWDDTFAKPEFAVRQVEYNKSLRHRGPYTPQMVFSGRLHSSGVNITQIAEKFGTRDTSPYAASVKFDGSDVVISGEYAGKASVTLVRFRPGKANITVGAGPNEGKSMTYVNLVTGIEWLGEWTGGRAVFKTRCDSGCTILVQKDGPTGLVLGAAQKR